MNERIGKGINLALGGTLILVPPLFVFDTYAALYLIYALCILAVGFLIVRPWSEVERHSRLVLVVSAAFLASAMLTHVVTGGEQTSWRHLESIHAKVLAIFPLIVLIRWLRPPAGCFWWGALLGSFAVGVSALLDLYRAFGFDIDRFLAETDFRVGGGWHPVVFGMLAAALTLIAAAGRAYFADQGRWSQLIWGLGVGFGLMATLLTNTRGAWLALLVALGIAILLKIRHLSGRPRAVLLMTLVLLPVMLYQVPRIEMRVDQAVADIRTSLVEIAAGKPAEAPIGARFEMWRAALLIADENPWLGAGLGGPGYQEQAAKLVAADRAPSLVAIFSHAHNQYLNTLVTRGTVGLFAELCLMLTCLWLFIAYWRQTSGITRTFAMTGMLVSVAYLVFGITDVPLEHKNTLLLYAYLMGVLLGFAGAGPRYTVSRLQADVHVSSPAGKPI